MVQPTTTAATASSQSIAAARQGSVGIHARRGMMASAAQPTLFLGGKGAGRVETHDTTTASTVCMHCEYTTEATSFE